MGCDFHWILEQRHPDGTWHATASKPRAYEIFDAAAPSWSDPAARLALHDADTGMRLGQRDYVLFGLLSNVRCPPLSQGPLARPGFPADASAYALAEHAHWGLDWHTQGHLLPEDLAPADRAPPTEAAWRAALRRLQGGPQPFPPALVRWVHDLRALAALHDGAPVLLPRVEDEDGGEWIHPQAEDAPQGLRASAHARLAAADRGLQAKGGPWRLLLAYDN